MTRLAAALASLTLLACPAGGQGGRPDPEVPLARQAIVEHARGGPNVLAGDVTVSPRPRSPGRTERVTVWLDDGGAAALRLGDLEVVVEADRVLLAHGLDAGSYVELRENGATGIELLERHLPPVPALPLRLALLGDAALDEPSPYLGRIAWESAAVTERIGAWRMAGRDGSGSTVSLSSRTGGRLTVVVQVEDGREIRTEWRGAGPPPARPAIDPATRERLAGVADLRARPGDVVAGRRMPDLAVEDASALVGAPVERGGVEAAPGGSTRLIIFRAWRAELEAVVEQAAERGPVRVVAVTPIGAGLLDRLREPAGAIAPQRLEFAVSAERSIDRFHGTANAALVVADERGVVERVLVLAGADDDAVRAALEGG